MMYKVLCLFIWTISGAVCHAQSSEKYLLRAEWPVGAAIHVDCHLEVGGDWLAQENLQEVRLPLSVSAHLAYQEELLSASDANLRSLRYYETAQADIKKKDGGIRNTLPTSHAMVKAQLDHQRFALNGLDRPLTRDQFDLVNVIGNTLALDRLLPGRELAEGDAWDHTADTLGPLLGMDHVAVCEVASVVTGESHRQVQIRLAGTVHGTVDGAATEIELRGAYLFHLDRKRITKFNFTVQEKRSPTTAVAGLDVTAKLAIVITPAEASEKLAAARRRLASLQATPGVDQLMLDATDEGFRLRHSTDWFVTAEERNLISLDCTRGGEQLAHCNIATLPARSAGRHTRLDEFERDIRDGLGERLSSIVAASEWTTARGHRCQGIVAQGAEEGVPIEWRYYLVFADDLRRVSLAVSIEASRLKEFADADRLLIDSLELIPRSTANAGSTTTSR